MECFICKKLLDNADLGETANVTLPTGKKGYVHTSHPGVTELMQEEEKAMKRV